jgi:hypothetical protein
MKWISYSAWWAIKTVTLIWVRRTCTKFKAAGPGLASALKVVLTAIQIVMMLTTPAVDRAAEKQTSGGDPLQVPHRIDT